MTKLMLSGAALTLFATMTYADVYKLDPAHTNARFEIGHFDTTTNHGGFYNITGDISYSAKSNTAHLELVIPVDRIITGNEQFDNHMKSADILKADQFPAITFKSTQFNFDGKHVKSVVGDLTILNKTHPVTLTATQFNCYENPMFDGAEVCGGDFTTTIDRTKWGVDFLSGMGIPNEVLIKVQVEAVKQ
ncbi:YceI family protein [Pseudomonas sp. F1_0610]|uniref:YceI family protein n=1 Tax=Pseudomonas sp. F1_0610 TaxID=3114284 RepID=UPI0039C3CEC2